MKGKNKEKVLIKSLFPIFFIFVLIFSSLSGCIDDVFNAEDPTVFSLKSWSFLDDEGFPSVFFDFSCNDRVTVKLFDSNSLLLDSDFFYSNSDEGVLHLSSYRSMVYSDVYNLVVYDNKGKQIFSQDLDIYSPDLVISENTQFWWERESIGSFMGGYTLIGITLDIMNNGGITGYPDEIVVTFDGVDYSGKALPGIVEAGSSAEIDFFVYKHAIPVDQSFDMSIYDEGGYILGSGVSTVEVLNNVQVNSYEWRFQNFKRKPKVPKPSFLFDYYENTERVIHEDYALYIFDQYDDIYIDILVDSVMLYATSGGDDVNQINYVASFVQQLDYLSDDDGCEYPRYPVETVFYSGDGGGDCEDKAILTAAMLNKLGYKVALFRLPGHMAVGVSLASGAVSRYGYYIDDYYYLETTNPGATLGYIPSEYQSIDDVTVYPISDRPLLHHSWKNNTISILTNTDMGDFVKVKIVLENYGSVTAEEVYVEGCFETISGVKQSKEIISVLPVEPGMREEISFTVDIPNNVETVFKTRLYVKNEVVHTKESSRTFPIN